MPGTSSWQLCDGEQIIACNTSLLGHRHFLIGITRVRNEALILRDTLDYVGKHVDAIVAYDDASTDRTLEILGGHPKVALIVTNRSWEADIEARRIAEGRHRGLLLQTAREQLQFDWIFCFDADERVTGDLRGFIEGTHSSDYDGVRVQLFDAYMTPGDHAPYQADGELLGFRRFFGPERRDILMLWRNRSEVIFHLASCGPCTSGVTRSSRMRSRCETRPLGLSASEQHSCGCPFGSPGNRYSFDNFSFLGQDRIDNLLKVHI